jgi:4-hydroxy-4-methyl-2-oxoglutarate aldolase
LPESSILADALTAQIAGLSAASVHEAAGKTGALPAAFKPLRSDMRVYGRALPVRCPSGDNLWIHHAIYQARPGEVLVVDTGPGTEFGYWGEVMTLAAQVRGIAGLVISGGVRDSLRLIEMGFPVFSATVCIRGTRKDPKGVGSIGAPIGLGDTLISRSDVILGDADGVVVIPADRVATVATEARARDEKEQSIFRQLNAGKTTLELYELPPLAAAD